MSLNHRLEIRIDDERMELLKDAARRKNRTVGAVIREAIDLHLKEETVSRRLKAVDALGRLEAPVSSPARMKKEFLEGYYRDPEDIHRRERPHVRRGR